MRAAAVKQKDYFILNGTKIWITNAEHAGVFLVMANANPTAVSHIFTNLKKKEQVMVYLFVEHVVHAYFCYRYM